MANARPLVLFTAEFVRFPIPIITLFWKDQIGMSLTDIMVVQAAFGLSVTRFQFPPTISPIGSATGHRFWWAPC